MKFNLPRIIVAGPTSGAGKTTISLALMATLQKRGWKVAPFKVGPDYIDPQFHRIICERASYNLDSWLTGQEGVLNSFRRGVRESEIAVIEGVMGLFDGSSPYSLEGSTAEIAQITKSPILLVVDAQAMGRSVGALVRGFHRYVAGIEMAGVILNRVSGEGHFQYLRPAIEKEGIPIIGWFPREENISLPERHLGLVPVSELHRLESLKEKLIDLAEKYLNLDLLLEIARQVSPLEIRNPDLPFSQKIPCRIAWAQDEVFHFSYEENKDLLQEAGATLIPFSPLNDSSLPPDCQGIWLGGGFPEMFARDLWKNQHMIREIRKAHQRGIPIYAECGGYMYLCERLIDHENSEYPMVGIIPGTVRMTRRLQNFGYAIATFKRDCLMGRAGTRVRGHRFHYSIYEPPAQNPPDPIYRIQRSSTGEINEEGFADETTLATYFHIHLASLPDRGLYFLKKCQK